MNDCAWWVRRTRDNARTDTRKRDCFEILALGPDTPCDAETITPLLHSLVANEPLPQTKWPHQMKSFARVPQGQRLDENGARISPFIRTAESSFVTQPTIDVLGQFNLGKMQLHPVQFFEQDGQEIDQSVHMLIMSEVKETFDHAASPKVIDEMPFPGQKLSPLASPYMVDDSVALRADALSGADLWAEKMFRGTFFVSDRLANGLRDAGISDYFDLTRARIL